MINDLFLNIGLLRSGKTIILLLCIFFSQNANAWWDPGHLVVAFIAYMNLDDQARERVDDLTEIMQRDYPYMNHFITTGPWPDDLKAEGVRTFDTWHYTNIPHNPSRIALATQPEIDIIWAINQTSRVLRSSRARDIDKARHLGFLVHLVADIHQPLHSTSVISNDLPGGNVGGNAFPLSGQWSNLHALWDDGCGYFSDYNDINPYGDPKQPLDSIEIQRLRQAAEMIMQEFPRESITGIELKDADFWALESHKLAIRFGYFGRNAISSEGRSFAIKPDSEPSAEYLERGQRVVKERIAAAGYRLAEMLNEIFGSGG